MNNGTKFNDLIATGVPVVVELKSGEIIEGALVFHCPTGAQVKRKDDREFFIPWTAVETVHWNMNS